MLGHIGVIVRVALVLLFAVLGSTGWAASWEDAIRNVEASARKYHDYAVEVGGTSWAGAMYNGYKFDDHRCAILGRMLGHPDAIAHLEQFDYPPMTSASDPHDLLVFSISLENWVAAARWAVGATESQRASVWNLECVGEMGIPATLFEKNDTPNAEFERNGTQLHVYGDIDAGFFVRFSKALEANPDIKEITLGSAGGSVADAILAGVLIRQRGLDTALYGNCFSACPLVFLGGIRRVIWAAPYRLGFHQISRGGEAVPLDDPIYRDVALYATRMGADGLTVVQWMQSSPPIDMYEPPVDDLCPPVVATFVQRRCGIDMN